MTGHANLTDATMGLVADALRDALGPYVGQGLVGVSCLAAGADQVFAATVLELGGDLEVILPAPDYRDRKVEPGNLATFDDLLSRATLVRHMPFESSGREAYMAAGEAVVRCVDRMLAVWDGGPSAGLGGTADVVALARELGVPVQVIWPEAAARGEGVG